MSDPTPTTRDVVNHMVRTPGLMFVAFGIMFAGMSGYAFGQFFHPLLVRFSGMGYANAAAVFGIVSVLTFGVGSPLGGYLVERFGKSDPSITCRIPAIRSEEHTSELQSLMRISYAVFCLQNKTKTRTNQSTI